MHLLPGDPDRLPVALKAAGAAGAPLFTVVDGAGAGPRPCWPPRATGRTGRAAADHRPAAPCARRSSPPASPWSPRSTLGAAGRRRPGPAWSRSAAAPTGAWRRSRTRSGRSARTRRALPRPGRPAGRDPRRRPATPTRTAEPGTAGRAAAGSGPRTVTELRRHALTATVYRAADANRALVDLLDAARDAVTAATATCYGRLAGD